MSHRTAAVAIAVVTGAVVTTVGLVGHANNDRHERNGHGQPSTAQIATAQKVSDLMLNELLAALFQEFNETTPDNVDEGEQAISLIFNDLNRNMRLVGTFGPLLGGAERSPGRRVRTDGPGPGPGRHRLHRRRAGRRQLALSSVGAPQQHVPPGLRALPPELHQRLLRPDRQPRPVGRHAGPGRTDPRRPGSLVAPTVALSWANHASVRCLAEAGDPRGVRRI